MSEGTVFIIKRGAAWSLQLTSTKSTSSLDCDPGWKNRRGDVGRGTRIGGGSLSPDTEKILDAFLEIDGVSYINIVEHNFLEFSFDRPVLPNDSIETDIVKVIKRLLHWDVAYVENNYSEPQVQAYIVPRFQH